MPLRQRSALFLFALPLLLWLVPAPEARAAVAVFRDRAAFNAAAQNLSTIDFEGMRPVQFSRDFYLDGVRFENINHGLTIDRFFNPNNTTLRVRSIGEFTQLTVELPPGTTAAGCDQFSRIAKVSVAGGSATMEMSDPSNFVGFTSDSPLTTLVIVIDEPEFTAEIILDNLSFGQRRADATEPTPLLFASQSDAAHAAALNAATQTPAPFQLETPHTLGADKRTRLALFLAGVRLDPGDVAQVVVRLTDSQQRVFDLQPESVGRAGRPSWLRQINVLLPQDLAPGDVNVRVNVRGVLSSTALIRIEPPGN